MIKLLRILDMLMSDIAVMYQIKDGVRFKPLEYLCEDMNQEIMEEVKNG